MFQCLRNAKYQQLQQNQKLVLGSKHSRQLHQHCMLAIKVNFEERLMDPFAHSAKVIMPLILALKSLILR